MANTLILNQPYVNVGLSAVGQTTFTVPVGGNYNFYLALTDLPPSNLTITLRKNGTTIFTAPSNSNGNQSAVEFKQGFAAATSDVITLVITGAAPNDSLLNSVKSVMSIGQGFF